jgi:hypothetical protein
LPGTGRQFVPAQPPPLLVWLEGAAAGASAGVAVGAVGVLVTGGGGEDVSERATGALTAGRA